MVNSDLFSIRTYSPHYNLHSVNEVFPSVARVCPESAQTLHQSSDVDVSSKYVSPRSRLNGTVTFTCYRDEGLIRL